MFTELDIEKIVPNPFQPRTIMDPERLEEISCSIKEVGIIQPLVVREHNGGYQLIAGERRFRGAQKAGLKKVPVIIKQVNDLEMLKMALIENLHREDLSPIDRANGIKDLMDKFSMTQKEISEIFNLSRSGIANILRLLDLDEEIKNALHHKKITEGHARALLSIKEDAMRRSVLARMLCDALSVRESEELTKRINRQSNSKKNGEQSPYSIHEHQVVEELRMRLGTKVDIVRDGETGRLEIEFYSEEDLDRIIETLLSLKQEF